MQGVKIKPKHINKFNSICDALEKAKIEYSIWNSESMIDSDYNGPIDIECESKYRYEEFTRIISNIIHGK